MIEIELSFNLDNHPMDDNIKNFWTLPDQQGYQSFKDKTKNVLSFLNQGEIFELDNGVDNKFLADFKTNRFLIESKRGVVRNIVSQIFIKVKPVLQDSENF